VDLAVGIGRRLGGLDRPRPLLFARQLADGRVAPALQRQRVRRVENRIDLLQPDRRILYVGADPVGARLERPDDELRMGRPEGEV